MPPLTPFPIQVPSLQGALPVFTRTTLAVVLLALSSLPLQAKDSWVEVRSPNFTVISNSGEKEARRIADQFEQFREVFHATLPQLRVDLGKPLIIFAVKNEDSLRILLPAFWETKGRVHPAGLYSPGEDRHFVAVRTDIEGENPYEVVYHEYTHAIMNLNFRDLPVWLGEGLAELFANSQIQSKEVHVGAASRYHLMELQQSRLIPVETLLMAGHDSPYYNEANRATVFYAESWAIVHYLMMDPDARKRQLLFNFMKAWDETGDQVKAAQATFGDLKKFSVAMESYARQPSFYFLKVPTAIHGDAKSYSSRELPLAEVAAYRAIFYIHTQRFNEAHSSVDEALQADPNLPLAHEARGLLAYYQQYFPGAEDAFARAIELHSTSSFVYYFDAQARLRHGDLASPQERAEVAASLEKAVSMNPQFAPAYAALASVYSMDQATHEKAFQAALKSVKLEPGNLGYAINYGYVLLNAGKIEDAKVLVPRIQEAARTPHDRSSADMLAEALESREASQLRATEYAERAKQAVQERVTDNPAKTAATSVVPENPGGTNGTEPKVAGSSTPTAPPKHGKGDELAVEGVIVSAECNAHSTGRLTLSVNNVPMKFLYSGLNALQVVGVPKGLQETPTCSDWKGKKVRLYFYATKDRPYVGELEALLFL
jgi:tetratricopeptide (TPR) repeat protein